MRKLRFLLLIYIAAFLFMPSFAFAGPTSSTYELKDYTFGSGGTNQSGVDSSTYTLFGTAGEVDYGKLTSSTYGLGGGLIYTLKSNVPPAPTFTNPASNYDRLKVVINTSNNPTDTTFAAQVATDSNFTQNVAYVQSDFTIGPALGSEDFMTYTTWGSTSGKFITQLSGGTTYYIKVKSRQGNFSESEYSASANATTSNSSLTFSLDSNSIAFGNLNVGNSYTDSSKTTVLTTTTNAYGGYIVYAKETQSLTSPGDTISDYSGTNSSPTTWSGTGFGYTTSDNNLTGGTSNRFSAATKYAGFTISASSPGDPVADHSAPVEDPTVSNEQFTISYRVTADNTKKAGTYTNTILYTIVPTF